jgi:hypothetical protein
MPNPPVIVRRGALEPVHEDEASSFRSRTVAMADVTLLNGMGVDAIRRAVDGSAEGGDSAGRPAVVLPCSCGHVLLARPAGD